MRPKARQSPALRPLWSVKPRCELGKRRRGRRGTSPRQRTAVGRHSLDGRHSPTAAVEQASMMRRSRSGEAKTRGGMEVGKDGCAYSTFYRATEGGERTEGEGEWWPAVELH
jgi:hypothetical protein